jgi:hypothetical protein
MKTFQYTLTSLIFTIPAAWLGLFATCIYVDWDWPQVCSTNRIGMWLALLALGVGVLTFAPIGLVYRERASRRARRGMYARPGLWSGWHLDWGVRQLQSTIETLWDDKHRVAWGEGDGEVISGVMRYHSRGWWVTVEIGGGMRVWVDRAEIWQWLQKVEALHAKRQPGESAIGERVWSRKIGRPLWMAYCDILEAVGGIEYPTDDARSRRYVPGQPWGRVEEYEKLRPSELK